MLLLCIYIAINIIDIINNVKINLEYRGLVAQKPKKII